MDRAATSAGLSPPRLVYGRQALQCCGHLVISAMACASERNAFASSSLSRGRPLKLSTSASRVGLTGWL